MRKLVYPEYFVQGSETTYLRQRLMVVDSETLEVTETALIKMTDKNQDTLTRMPTDFNLHLGNLYNNLLRSKKLPAKTSYDKFLRDFYSATPNSLIEFSLTTLKEPKKPFSNFGYIINDKFKNYPQNTSAVTKMMFPKDWDSDYGKLVENDTTIRLSENGRFKVYLVALGVKKEEDNYVVSTQQIHQLTSYIEKPVCALKDFKLITDETKETEAIVQYLENKSKSLYDEAVKVMLSWQELISEE